MKLFPDEQKRKKFMKGGLPVVFTIAWTPIVWMLLASLLGPVIEPVFHSWQPVVLIIGVMTLLSMLLLIRLFKTVGLKSFDKGD
jgi:hypothetical protein